ncbi:MAG: hypothetical protein A3J74_01385 [Elusimicrobia bacterium RIFCSPHIGHO2_02_FULL_57_9]|nr:MAG: hypothetical protein A3J74_01385 [Elusimicrobia bacterium RIFCSPHIGHO2_02_FULL_57_9]
MAHISLFLLFPLLSGLACAQALVEAPAQAETKEPVKTDAAIISSLVDLLENKDRFRVDLSKAEGTPLGEILTVGSPIGYNLRNRFLNTGIPLAEALSRNADPVFREKLVTLARWDSNPETRSAALIAVAQARELKDLVIFREALVHLNPAVRFGALEALQVWGQGHPAKAIPLLSAASDKDYEPILKVYAAAGVARLGDESGLTRLRRFLDDGSWLVRAMAGRYLGDFGRAEDYDTLVSRIGRELNNDFVVAEYCIAALKLFPKKKA